MSIVTTHHRIRLALDASSFEAPRDVLRAAIPAIWSGRDLAIELGLFDHGEPVDTSNLADLTFCLKCLPSEGEAPAWDAPLYLQQTLPIIDHTVTPEEWEAGTDAHATLYFAAEATRIAPGAYWLAVVARTSDDPPRELTFGAGPCDVHSDGFARGTVVPIIEGQAYSVSAADAHFVSYTAGDTRYLTPAAGDARYLALAEATSAYLTRTEGDGRYLDLGTAATLASQSWSDGRFLTKAANLADLPNMAQARASLDVPSRDEWRNHHLVRRGGGLILPAEQWIEGASDAFRWGLGGGLIRLCLALETWQPASVGTLLASHESGNSRWSWEVLSTGDWRFTWVDAVGGPAVRTLPSPGLLPGRPYDLVLCMSQEQKIDLYVDGVWRSQLDLAGMVAVDLGRDNRAPCRLLGGTSLAGTLYDQIVVMNTVLDAPTIAALAAQPANWSLQPLMPADSLAGDGGFDLGTTIWKRSADSPSTLTFPVDEGYGGSPCARAERPVGSGVNLRLTQTVGLLSYIGKSLRLHFRYRSVGPDTVTFRVRGIGAGYPYIHTVYLPPAAEWITQTLDFVVPSTVPSDQIGLMFESASLVYVIWIDDLTLLAAGVTARVDLRSGTGARLPNQAPALGDWGVRGGEVGHLCPAWPGPTWTERTRWAAGMIATTAGTTWLTRLPAGAQVVEVWAEVTKAGAASDSLLIGTAAIPARFATLPLASLGWQRLTPVDPWPLSTAEDLWLSLNQTSAAEIRLHLVLR